MGVRDFAGLLNVVSGTGTGKGGIQGCLTTVQVGKLLGGGRLERGARSREALAPLAGRVVPRLPSPPGMTNSMRGPARAIDAVGERILAAALAEFVERGFQRARPSAIARVAEVSPRTFRRYFPDKAELFREVVRTTILELVRGADSHELFLARLRWPEAVAMSRWYREEFEAFPELRVFYETEILRRIR